jgi:hypothetical protein
MTHEMIHKASRRRARPLRHRLIAAVSILGAFAAELYCAAPASNAAEADTALEDIYVLRSIREEQAPTADWCASSRTGFESFPSDAERFFSFWSVQSRPEDGRVVDAKHMRVAELRACFGPTNERARQNFYAEIRLGAISFRGNGECRALMIDFPETGLFPVSCQLILGGLPAPFVGGLLTTNTMTTKAPFGTDTEPPGYTQASIATIRLWRARTSH